MQANVCNMEAVRFFAAYTDVMVQAREQIRHIIEGIKRENITDASGELVRIEAFAHGSLYIDISGKCGMSLTAYNARALTLGSVTSLAVVSTA